MRAPCRRDGNTPAQRVCWRRCSDGATASGAALARSRAAGWALAPEYAAFDAERRFGVAQMRAEEPTECISGQILQGVRKPHECPAFGTRCTPEHPLGATMVSSEGACAAYYRYRRFVRLRVGR